MVGRKKEIKELNRLYEGGRAELIAIHGRRRVGKTYLVDETFAGHFTFRHAGLSPDAGESKGLLKEQLEHFYHSLELFGMEKTQKPASWMEAFFLLEKFLQEKDSGERQVVFLDELPWMDTPKSGFMRAFEGFWNNWGCHRKNLMVIVCGSANSWILNKLINSHGGLYNRVTCEIQLSPFSLSECEEFFESRNIALSKYDIAQSYMIFGGIPYYLGYFDGELSFAQNVDRLIFSRNARLKEEYNKLFGSLFTNPHSVKQLVEFLYSRRYGYTRREITEHLKISDNGRLSNDLNALIASGFAVKYIPFGKNKRSIYYKLTDPFCLFWLQFVKNGSGKDEKFWQHNLNAQQIVVWRGLAYETVCFNHINQIKKALGIAGVSTDSSAWPDTDNTEKTQIDLLLSRSDNVINMCEIKYYSDNFTVDKDYYRHLLHRQQLLAQKVSPKISVRGTLITTFGLSKNEYSGIFTNVITLEDLFS